VQEESGAKVSLEAGKTYVTVEGDTAQVAAAVKRLASHRNPRRGLVRA
jgi:microcompartment protein CcmL/EutN